MVDHDVLVQYVADRAPAPKLHVDAFVGVLHVDVAECDVVVEGAAADRPYTHGDTRGALLNIQG